MSIIKTLDHGFVRLVGYMGSDLSVVRNARGSYDAAWRAGEDEGSDTKLLRYLLKNNHSTPFESVTLTFEIQAPIFVFRQWHRHRTWSYNELSARYRELPEMFYVPDPSVIGVQSKSNKQMRVMTGEDNQEAANLIELAGQSAFETYRELLKKGVPRELARLVLPLGTYSHMFGTVNLWNLLRFLNLRDHEHAQWEMQVYAQALGELAQTVAPTIMKIWGEGR